MSDAVLSDGTKQLKLVLPPESIQVQAKGEYSSNLVLNTVNPQLRGKGAAITYSLRRCLLISEGFTVNQQPVIDTLLLWLKGQNKLSFRYNSYNLTTCYINSLSYEVKQWRQGNPVHAEIDLDLLEGHNLVKVANTPDKKKITPREQQKYQQNIKKKLTPSKKLSLGLPNEVSIDVSALSQVTINGKTWDYSDLIEELG